ncbi:Fc.00g116060.m01.CDS01 [Cosmosporella sp. VM-42]
MTWVTLGLFGIFQFSRFAEIFGVSSSPSDRNKDSETGVALLLGSRDLTFATALFALGRTGKNDEMGTVILSSMIICAADVYLMWKRRRYAEMIVFGVGASIWAVIGSGLKGFFV